MSMSVDSLKNNLTNPARVYLWDIIIPSPKGGGDGNSLELRCQSTMIPGRSVGEIKVPYKGTPGIKFPGKATMSQKWTATFVEGLDKKIFAALTGWAQATINARTGIGLPDVMLKSDIYLWCLKSDGKPWLKIKLVGCYVESVEDVPLTYDTEAIVVFNTTFSYDYWEEV